MMASMDWIGGADAIVAWLLTYAVHSTILLGAAAALTVRLVRADAWRETVWRTALVGALLTSALQSGLGMRPLAGEWRFSAGERSGKVSAEMSNPPLTNRAAFDGATTGIDGAGVEAVAAGSTFRGTTAERADAGPAANRERVRAGPATESASGQWGQVGIEAVPASQSAPAASRGAYTFAPTWARVLLASWAVVALLLLLRLAHRQWRLHRWLRDRRPITEGDLLSVLAALRRNAGVWRPVGLTASPACPSPLALGTSEICVPDRFLRELDREQQRSALAHELAHIARRDPGWHLLTGLVEAVFFFQPLNRVARLRLREAAENLSDDWAVRQTGSALGLARCLAEVASWVGRGPGPVAAGTMAMAEGGSPLLQRVERLLGGRSGTVPRARLRTVAATALVLLVLVAAPVVSAGDGRPGPASGEAHASGEALAEGAGPGGGLGEAHLPPSQQPAAAGRLATQPPPAAGRRSESRADLQEQVIRHGAPDEPLDARWQWAADEAERRGDVDYWVAYAFDRPLPAGDIHVEDSGSWSDSEIGGPPLGALIYGPSYERPEEPGGAAEPQDVVANPESLQPVVVLFRMVRSRAGAVHAARISVRTATAGMPLRGAPIYWLGPASDSASFDWLRGRFDELQDVDLRATVVEAISMHEATDRVVPFLADIIAGSRRDVVRQDAVEGLVWHATDRGVALLRETALEDHSRSVREEATETLGEIGTPAAVAVLDELLRVARSDAVREEAAESLAQRRDPEVLEVLVRVAMEDPDGDVRGEALDAIAGFPSSTAVPALEQIALTHPRTDMRGEAIEALGDVDPAAAADVLERILQSDAHADVREEALDVLTAHRSTRAAEAIFQAAMTDPDPDVQDEAVEKLGELEPAAALPRLERIMWDHPNTDMRREAVESLAEMPADIALPVLDDIVERHEDHEVVREAVEVIGEFSTDASTSRLMRIVREHPWEDVRREALDQLEDRPGPQ